MISKLVSYPLLLMIQCYQYCISPLFPSACRHTPSCSQYTKEAIQLHGPFRGLFLGLKRIVKCHPGGSWGYDPVPNKKGCTCE